MDGWMEWIVDSGMDGCLGKRKETEFDFRGFNLESFEIVFQEP